MLLVLYATGSAALVGVVSAAGVAGWVVVQLPGGFVADRFDRRTVMIICQVISLGATASLAITTWMHEFYLGQVVAVGIIEGACYGLFATAEAAALTTIVGSSLLTRALTLNQGRSYAAGLVGPSLGGILFAVARSLPFFSNVAAYATSAALLTRIPSVKAEKIDPSAEEHLSFRQLAVGFINLAHYRFLRMTGTFVAASDLLINSLTVAVLVLAAEHGLGPAGIGVILSCSGAGGLLGAALGGGFRNHQPSLRVFMAAVPAYSCVVLAVLATVPGAWIGLPFALVYVPWPMWQGLVTARWMGLVPDRERARTFGALNLATALPSLLAPALSGVLVTVVGATWVIAAISLGMALLAIVTWLPTVQSTLAAASDDFGRRGDPQSRRYCCDGEAITQQSTGPSHHLEQERRQIMQDMVGKVVLSERETTGALAAYASEYSNARRYKDKKDN